MSVLADAAVAMHGNGSTALPGFKRQWISVVQLPSASREMADVDRHMKVHTGDAADGDGGAHL
jgi:hypothetical protein